MNLKRNSFMMLPLVTALLAGSALAAEAPRFGHAVQKTDAPHSPSSSKLNRRARRNQKRLHRRSRKHYLAVAAKRANARLKRRTSGVAVRRQQLQQQLQQPTAAVHTPETRRPAAGNAAALISAPAAAVVTGQQSVSAAAEKPFDNLSDAEIDAVIENSPALAANSVVPTATRAATAKSNSAKTLSRGNKVGSLDSLPARSEAEQTENLGSDVKSGSVVVRITENANATIKIGLAKRGVSVIEFPANDPIYAIHPGDENYVSIDCRKGSRDSGCHNSPTDAIVLRPGKMFSNWEAGEDTATVITVQRVSGIVVSLIVVPVKSIAQNAFHVAVRYDLDNVVSARSSAGLAVNLNTAVDAPVNRLPSAVPPDKTEIAPNTAQNHFDRSADSVDPADRAAKLRGSAFTDVSYTPNADGGSGIQTNAAAATPAADSSELVNPADDLAGQTVLELKRVAASAGRLYFGKPQHGISMAAAANGERTGDYSINVVAVRNTLDKPIRLVPDQPELFIESQPAKGKAPVISERLSILNIATSANDDDVLAPGEVYYFAIAYKNPILGAKQVLRLGFAQRQAADEPATVILLGLSR